MGYPPLHKQWMSIHVFKYNTSAGNWWGWLRGRQVAKCFHYCTPWSAYTTATFHYWSHIGGAAGHECDWTLVCIEARAPCGMRLPLGTAHSLPGWGHYTKLIVFCTTVVLTCSRQGTTYKICTISPHTSLAGVLRRNATEAWNLVCYD